MEIETPNDDITEVELEYIKIEKHCFSCFSLFHEESDCPHLPPHAPPPKDRVLGITQSIALQRIEAEKRRHDDRRGYRRPDDNRANSRPDDARVTSRPHHMSSSQSVRDRAPVGRPYPRVDDHRRDHSNLSRTAHPHFEHHRYGAPSVQYRVVEKNRLSSGSSAPHLNSVNQSRRAENNGINLSGHNEVEQQINSRRDFTPVRNLSDRLKSPVAEDDARLSDSRNEITPSRNLQSRIEIPATRGVHTHSGSRERRSALERLSEPSMRKPPSFESGRLQLNEGLVEAEAQTEHMEMEIQTQEPATASVVQRVNDSSTRASKRTGTSIPMAPQSKSLGKRKVVSRRKVSRSPSKPSSKENQALGALLQLEGS
ncbi:Glyoxalase I [Raphanus sativus]|nr:Glyoxalase I [Raphanus sativus]